MNIAELLNSPTPPQSQTLPQTPVPNPLEEKIAMLEAQVSTTKSQLDDIIVNNQKAALLSEFNAFKSSIPDFDETALFSAMEERYQEYINEGASEEQAQTLVDKVFQNPIGWRALWSDIQQKSMAKTPDAILPSANGSNTEELPATRVGLGKFLNKQGAK